MPSQYRIAPGIYQALPVAQSLVIIQAQQDNSGATDGDSPNDLRAGKFEMIVPVLRARIEQRHDFAAGRINRGEVGAFVAIADHAGQRQILLSSLAAVFERKDVIYRMSFRPVVLMDQAVFAAPASAFDDQSAQMSWDTRARHRRIE